MIIAEIVCSIMLHMMFACDFWPIILCNMAMKMVVKTISNKLKRIFPKVFDEEQSTFIQGRLITDNTLIVMEYFHWLKKKTKGNKVVMAFKLNISKACNRLE